MVFQAMVAMGVVPTKDTPEGVRKAKWIPASQIPDDLILQWLQLDADSKKAPRNIPGMAWDLDKQAWRNMKNARSTTTTPATVTFDLSAADLFSIK